MASAFTLRFMIHLILILCTEWKRGQGSFLSLLITSCSRNVCQTAFPHRIAGTALSCRFLSGLSILFHR